MRSTLSRSIVPGIAIATIGMALVWNYGLLPWTSPLAEIAGLAAVLLAPGLAIEPAIRGPGWSPVERLGFAGAVSIACVIVLGLGLHLIAVPITARTVLFLLLATSLAFGLLSLRFRHSGKRAIDWKRWRLDVVVGVGSVVLLATAFLASATFRAAPNQLPLEIALVDSQGRLLVMPLRMSTNSETIVRVAVRSPSGEIGSAHVRVAGNDVSSWTNDDVPLTRKWSIATVPIVPRRDGTIRATIQVEAHGSRLMMPVQIVVSR